MLIDFTPIEAVIFHSLLSTVPVVADITFRFIKGATEINSRRYVYKCLFISICLFLYIVVCACWQKVVYYEA